MYKDTCSLYPLIKVMDWCQKMTDETQNELVQNPKILGAVELPKIDLRKYNGQKSVIESVVYQDHATHGKYAKVISKTLEGSPEGLEIKASKILGLYPVKNTETDEIEGYGWGTESKTASFLKKYECDTLKDLVGKEIIVTFEVVKGKDILTF